MPAVISADGTRIGDSVMGRGPTLVSVGGALMYRAIDECHAGMTAALPSCFTVITYDRRGRGDSGDSDDTRRTRCSARSRTSPR
jgi:pimeloyl-ACP methyl ester carboxylesterase